MFWLSQSSSHSRLCSISQLQRLNTFYNLLKSTNISDEPLKSQYTYQTFVCDYISNLCKLKDTKWLNQFWDFIIFFCKTIIATENFAPRYEFNLNLSSEPFFPDYFFNLFIKLMTLKANKVLVLNLKLNYSKIRVEWEARLPGIWLIIIVMFPTVLKDLLITSHYRLPWAELELFAISEKVYTNRRK